MVTIQSQTADPISMELCMCGPRVEQFGLENPFFQLAGSSLSFLLRKYPQLVKGQYHKINCNKDAFAGEVIHFNTVVGKGSVLHMAISLLTSMSLYPGQQQMCLLVHI